MTTTIGRLNSVDIETVAGLAQAIADDPTTAETVWRSTVEWQGGFRSESHSREFSPTPSDEPEALGGDDTAANPVEQLLGALGNCLAVGYAANATAVGVELRGVTVELEGDLDLHTFLGLAEGNAGFESITARVSVDTDAGRQTLEDLHDKVVSTSPVGHTLARAVPVSVDLA